jgi:hypothetical protein
MKTALQQAIDLIQIKIQAIEGLVEYSDCVSPVLRVLRQLKREMVDILPAEQHSIERAYAQGTFNEHHSATDYYNKTYNNETRI